MKKSLLLLVLAALVMVLPSQAEITYAVYYGGTGLLAALGPYDPAPDQPKTWMWVSADAAGEDATHIAITLNCTGRNETRLELYQGRPVNVLFTGLTPSSAKTLACSVTVASMKLSAAKTVNLAQ
jgi:hypothetical protein